MSDLPEISVPKDGKSWVQVKARLSFTCAYEKDRIPPRDPEADQLYLYARWLRKKNLLPEDPAQYPPMERLLRIATAYGHDKANLELRSLLGEGNATSDNREEEIYQLTQDLIRQGIPGGYYDMARMLEQGYGVKEDDELALKYYRKAADLGNPEAQYVVGDKLVRQTGHLDIQNIGMEMYHCAAEQGHGQAALEYAIHQQALKNYDEALKIFQLGAKAGNETAAFALEKGFNGPQLNDELEYLGQTKDPERVRRYRLIGEMLSGYSYLKPQVPEIDRIVPLPPAKLPAWNGKLEWQEAWEANQPPPLPSEARIVAMAKAKGLDPATGRPLPK
ncbi:SEL1-like repeat protein [Azospira inquinata]|uniref:Sel1 repeat family protein n=1 Tax=Azospira inquinata TaxID=2785627 RepID=A0A975XUK7_9RHOO|nr:sel1 repeat family protein [Azospira inquinata]QWT45791.1 sel1 repeat family protein [Azospira inquinata]QWT48887.1 sel1 repeat family protein [Azospira inquinata]